MYCKAILYLQRLSKKVQQSHTCKRSDRASKSHLAKSQIVEKVNCCTQKCSKMHYSMTNNTTHFKMILAIFFDHLSLCVCDRSVSGLSAQLIS